MRTTDFKTDPEFPPIFLCHFSREKNLNIPFKRKKVEEKVG